MSENTAPLSENQYVKNLFSILKDNGKDTSGLTALLGHVNEMESFIKSAEDRITEMKSQLAEMKEVQKHPIKTVLQNTIKSLEQKIAGLRGRLSQALAQIVNFTGQQLLDML